jgi:septum formation protein
MRNPPNPLIWLASASPRRSALLTQIGVEHRIQPVAIDERARPGEEARAYVERLAIAKARSLWEMLAVGERAPVLAADTAVVLGSAILGKPRDRADGLLMLERLSGRTHHVYTAVALQHAERCACRTSVSEVVFRTLSHAEIRAYWESGEPADKAGAYAIQGYAARFVERIAGSYSGVVGLPLFETAQLLADCSSGRATAPAAEGLHG